MEAAGVGDREGEHDGALDLDHYDREGEHHDGARGRVAGSARVRGGGGERRGEILAASRRAKMKSSSLGLEKKRRGNI